MPPVGASLAVGVQLINTYRQKYYHIGGEQPLFAFFVFGFMHFNIIGVYYV